MRSDLEIEIILKQLKEIFKKDFCISLKFQINKYLNVYIFLIENLIYIIPKFSKIELRNFYNFLYHIYELN